MATSNKVLSPSPSRLYRLRKPAPPPPALEVCELCSAPIGEAHPHLLELEKHQILCACDACAMLFSSSHASRYHRVPRDIFSWPDFSLSDLQWQALQIPIDLAFIFRNSRDDRVVTIYPSAAGATESSIEPEVWADLVSDNPLLDHFEPDVEALLVNRLKGRREYWRAPIDQCFRLVGIIRTHWRGFSGGSAVWEELDRFFDTIRRRSDSIRGSIHA